MYWLLLFIGGLFDESDFKSARLTLKQMYLLKHTHTCILSHLRLDYNFLKIYPSDTSIDFFF